MFRRRHRCGAGRNLRGGRAGAGRHASRSQQERGLIETTESLFSGDAYDNEMGVRLIPEIDDEVLSAYELGGRYVAAAALRIASWASSIPSRTVVSTSETAPPPPTAMASATADALSGASSRNTPLSNSPKAYQKPWSFPPSDSATSRAAALLSCG